MRSRRLTALAIALGLISGGGGVLAQGQPSFTKSSLQGASLSLPTSLQFGPDGRLYVSEQGGLIKAFTVDRVGTGSYSVTSTEVIDLINSIPNHNDDGALNPAITNRMITGILVTGSGSNPVIYVTSSDPRIAVGEDSGLDTNSSSIARLTWNGASWDLLELVRGLPRSEENHSANGMAIDEASGHLYVAQGGNTNMGAPSNNFGLTPEYTLAAAILRIDLNAIGETTYDVPTLDDPSRPNSGPGGSDQNDPFGGNDGANQGIIVENGPVQVWAPGYRNPYDVLITSDGRIYTIDNGPNSGWGGPPSNCGNSPVETGSRSYGDQLHYVADLGDATGVYGGHPCPYRAGATINGQSTIPAGTADPQQCQYLIPGQFDGAMHVWNSSTNGLCEYTATNFGGAMQGNLIAATWNSNTIERIQLGPDGTSATVTTLFANVGSLQLDVTAQGPGEAYPGTIWSCDLPQGKVWVFEPSDLGSCTAANDPTLDEDGDGYSNADEIASGTDPCSGADVPPDNDGDSIGDITDPDDDNDGVPDNVDAFAIDPDNGLSTELPIDFGWAIGEPGYGLAGLGFTGLMVGAGVDYLDRFEPGDLTPGGAAGKFTIDVITDGDAFGSFNSQDNAFQLGVNVSTATGPFVVHTKVDSPYFDGRTPTGYESAGAFIGVGDQNNYFKVALGARSGSAGVGAHIVHESQGVVLVDKLVPLGFLSATGVHIFLAVDPVAGTVQPRAALDNAAAINLDAPIALTGPLLDAVRSPTRAMAAGLISTSRGGSPFAATWDFFRIVPAGEGAESRVAIDPPGTGINGSTWGLGSFQIQNNSTSGQRITRVAFDVTGTVLPDMVFDPYATAGDTTGRDFTPNANAGLVGLGSHTFAWPKDGGYQTLDILFNDFDPGESFAFAVDMDPTTINGSAPPGPNDSGSVSGLEVSGALARVYFSDGTVGVSHLFRSPLSLDASEAIVRSTVASAPAIDVMGVSEPAMVTTPGQTVRVFGVAGSGVRLVVLESGLFTAGVPGGGFDIDPYEANSVLSVQEYGGTIGSGGYVDIPITLVKTHALGGISYIAASVVKPDGTTGLMSNVAVVELADSDLMVSAMSLDFGAVVSGQSVMRALTLTANDDPVTISGLNLSGETGDYTITSAPALPATIPADGSIELQVRYAPTDSGSDEATLTITHDGLNSPIDIALTGQGVTQTAGVLHRINVAGPTSPAADGSTTPWTGDTQSAPSAYVTGGTGFSTTGAAITLDESVPASAPASIFQTNRWDEPDSPEMSWALPVPSGEAIEVRLYLAETWSGASAPGKRRFDIRIEGQTIFDDIDMASSHGFRVGFMLSHALVVNDGVLNVEFLREVQNPQINAIEVLAADSAANSPPSATADSASVDRGQSVVIPLLANDSDADGALDPGSVAVIAQPAHGTVQIDALTGDATYMHDGTSGVSDSFTYSVRDDQGAVSNHASVNISVYGDPVAGQVLYRVNAGGVALVAPGGAWEGDTGGSPSAYLNAVTSGAMPAGTTATIDMSSPTIPDGTPGSLFQRERWDPADGQEMRWSFPVEIGQMVEVRLYFAELAVNFANKRKFDVLIEGQPVLVGYDVFAAAGGKHRGVVETFGVASDGVVDIEFRHVLENPAIKGIEIVSLAAGPQPPHAGDDATEVESGGSVVIDVLTNDSDADGEIDPATVVITTHPLHGSAVVDAVTGEITYTNNGDASDTDSLLYTVRDDSGDVSNEATVTIAITGAGDNEKPLAANDSSGFNPDGSVIVDVLANDVDPDGVLDPASVVVVTLPAYGVTSVNPATGEITYTNLDGSVSFDSFAYVVSDTQGAASDPATVTLAANPAPVATDDAGELLQGDSIEVDVLANDSDDGDLDPASVEIVSQPATGSVSVDPSTGAVTYDHDGSLSGEDLFSYSVRDTLGRSSNVATVTLTITPIDAGVLVQQGLTLRLESDSGLIGDGPEGLRWNDQSATGADVTASGSPAVLPGAVNGLDAIGLDGIDDALDTVASVPGTSTTGRSVFVVARYIAGTGGLLHGDPDACDGSTAPGIALGINASGSLVAGGVCPGGLLDSGEAGSDGLWLSHAAVLEDGLLVHYRDGSPIDTGLVSVGNNSGVVSIGRAAEGGFARMDVAAVLVYDSALSEPQRQSVESYLFAKYLNQAPLVADDVAEVDRAATVSIDVLANDVDTDGTLIPASVTVITPPAFGSTEVDSLTGVVTYTHDGSLGASDEFFYTVTDNLGRESEAALVTIAVVPSCPADIASPFGVLDVTDIAMFLQLFSAEDPGADFADPPAVFDINDVLLFLQLYTQGCP